MKRFLFTALTCVLVSVAVMAQNNGGQRQRMDPTELYNRQAERLAKQMKLDDEKSAVFKVLYLDYQTARRNAATPRGNAEEERVDFKKLTDAQATELIQKRFAAQEAQLNVDKEYLPKFLEVLTPSQAAQVYLQRGGGLRGGQGMPEGGPGRPGGGFGGGPRGGFGGFGGGDF